MQRISRIYVSHFGSPTAWYDSHLFGLDDPDTDSPTDTVFNLENAGGKTSLLSYIFSCFDPKLDRWLQHLQTKNHHFHDYFSRDGRPSFILIEWRMPGRAAGLPDYSFLIGQAVTIKDNAERNNDVERWFFAHETAPGLSMENFPAPGLHQNPVRTMPEFVHWLQEATAKSKGDFFRTKTQDDWIKHLGNVRGLDIELLRMQVDFNSNEGGMEEGFLTFNSEADLIRRFLLLTLDPEKSATVRAGLAQTADKLKSRPRYEQQLQQLTKLHTAMVPFVDAAAEFQAVSEQHGATRRDAASLAAALRRGGQETEAAAAEKRSYAEAQEALVKVAEENAELHTVDVVALKGLQLHRRIVAAKAIEELASEKQAAGGKRIRMLHGAKALGHWEAKTEAAKELEALVESEEQGLQSVRQQAEIQGALLDSALAAAEAREKSKMAQANTQGAAAQQEMAAIGLLEQQINSRLSAIANEQGQVQAFLERLRLQRHRLEQDGLVLTSDLRVETAIERVQLKIEELETQDQALGDRILGLQDQEQQHQSNGADQGLKAAKAASDQKPLEDFLSKGRSLHDELAQMEVMRAAADAELADPDSVTLLDDLEGLLAETDREISERDVRLAQLSSDRSSIVETGLAGRNADVDAAVRQLHALGIRSARAANTYVADLISDVDRASQLVLSDPARFLGIAVAQGDWSKLEEKRDGVKVKLRAPVTVAQATLDTQDAAFGKIVFAPEDAALFNKDAARVALGHLDTRIASTAEQRDAYLKRRTDGSAGREMLLRYQREFGAARLKQADADLNDLKVSESTARARQKEFLLLVDQVKQDRVHAENQRKSFPRKIEASKNARRRLAEYLHDFEEPSGAKQKRSDELASQTTFEEARLTSLAVQREEVDTRRLRFINDKVMHENNARVHSTHRAGISYIDRKYPAEQQLEARPRALEVLRATYDDAAAALEAQERDKLGVLADRLKTARLERQAAETSYRKDYGDLSPDELEPLRALDFEPEVREQNIVNQRLAELSSEASNRHASAQTEHEIFWRNQKQRRPPTQQMEALNDSDLARKISTTEDDVVKATEVADRARREAHRAREQVADAELSASKLSILLANLIAAVSKMDEDFQQPSLPIDPELYTTELIRRHGETKERVDRQRDKALTAFQALVASAMAKDLIEVEPELSRDIIESNFDLTCSDRLRVLELILDRIAAAKDTLDTMEPDLQNSIGELYNLTFEGIALLTRACNKTMPMAAPYIGGKPIIKMKANFKGIPVESRKEAIRAYFNGLIKAGIVPAKGADLVVQSLVAISGRPDLGLEVLKMEQNEAHQYQLASELKGSKGQGSVIAMFLYLLISQLRSDTQATAKRAGGGPLILDNPFAKVQTRALIDAQRLLAKEIGVQLIFFTANADANILAGFRRVIRLRKSHMNSRSQRSHIEMISATFEDLTTSELSA
ncbi:hypothetical protein [Pseudomonas sp. CGJS7]|uniref:hypothetical protein n=1 Tax=Pseudomonas sp. CGJS7 TaxID=3109348 RepID=UPI00300986AD